MSPLKRILPILFALIVGALGIFLVHSYLNKEKAALEAQRQQMFADYQEPYSIIVARKPIAEGEILVGEALASAPVPKKFIVPTATGRAEDVIGLKTKAPFSPGEPILRDKLKNPLEDVEAEKKPVEDSKLSLVTPPGKRAVTLNSSEIDAIRQFVRPGDKVDVSWTIEVPGKSHETVNMFLFQAVQVLAVDQKIIGAAETESVDEKAAAKSKDSAATVTIALSPKEIGMLVYAREQGKIFASLRSSMETGEDVDVEPINRSTVMNAILSGGDPFAESSHREVKVCRGLNCSDISVNE